MWQRLPVAAVLIALLSSALMSISVGAVPSPYSYKRVPIDEDDSGSVEAASASHERNGVTALTAYRPDSPKLVGVLLLLVGAAAVFALLLLLWLLPGSSVADPLRLGGEVGELPRSDSVSLLPAVDYEKAIASRLSEDITSSLSLPSLQRRHVALLLASMSSEPTLSSTADSPPLTAVAVNLLPILPFPPTAAPCSSQPSAVLLLSSPSTHISGVYSGAGQSSDDCALRFLSIVSGPVQQAIEVGRASDASLVPVVRVDGVRLLPTKVAVWPLLNRGNLSMTTTNTSLIVGLQLGYNRDTFDYYLHLELPLLPTSSSASPLFTALRMHVSASVTNAVGAWMDGEKRAEYVLPASCSLVRRYGVFDATTAVHEPNIGLNTTSRRLEGPSLFGSPLVPFDALPLASVSFHPLLPTSPVFSIPRIIHQTWFGPRIPPWLWINSWRRDYLQRYDGWLHLLWRNGSVVHLELLDRLVWNSESTFNGHSDVSRTAMTRAYGGMYIDADSLSLDTRPLDELYRAANSTGFFIAREKEGSDLYAAGVYGTQPHHPVMRLFQSAHTQHSTHPAQYAPSTAQHSLTTTLPSTIPAVTTHLPPLSVLCSLCRFWQHNNTVTDAGTIPWKRIGPGAATQALSSCARAEERSTCSFTEVPWRKFFPVYWARQQFATQIDASLYPDSVMFQFGFTTNGINEHNHEQLINGRRRRRRLV